MGSGGRHFYIKLESVGVLAQPKTSAHALLQQPERYVDRYVGMRHTSAVADKTHAGTWCGTNPRDVVIRVRLHVT